MGVYIKGLQMPKGSNNNSIVIEITPECEARQITLKETKNNGIQPVYSLYEAISVPDRHGNLIDRTPFLDEKFIRIKDDKGIERYMIDAFDLLKAPVIIPAERSYE